MNSESMWIWLIPLLPLLSAVLTGIFGAKLLKEKSHFLVIPGVASAAILSLIVLAKVAGSETDGAVIINGYNWFDIGGLHSQIAAMVDPLTAIMLATVSVVATFVVIYSRGYMAGDKGYFRFFAYLGLFVFSMLMLILANNFLMLYVFWEAVGLCSYLLIGFYYDRPSAAAAAKKAFLVNRVGDFGFALGILLIFLNFHTVDFQVVFSQLPAFAEANPGWVTTIALCLFVGATGKSAQLPLYVWLPDAMEGPSPVSALIHAATMVTAGVYMVVRCGAIFTASPTAMAVVATIGGLTALFAATIALAQTDIKRILAYSTISQLGYMFLAVGVGAATAGVFHLYTHAFFKALLFLAAGSIMHAMHDHIDLKDMGGLKKDIPFTHWTFLIGALALAGFPGLSGFFSKDEILAASLNHPTLAWLGWIGVLTAALTAFYTFRCYFLAFHGPRRLPSGVDHPHESKVMNFSLIVLAIGAIVVGYANMGSKLDHFLNRSDSVAQFAYESGHASHAEAAATHQAVESAAHHGLSHHAVMGISIAVVALGIGLAALIYLPTRDKSEKMAQSLAPVRTILANKYYVDELYAKIVVDPLRRLGHVCFSSDVKGIDSILWIITAIPRGIGLFFSLVQRGNVQTYALLMALGLAAILVLVMVAI